MATQQIIIKKYENRRLYDTSKSRYVNLADIAGLVREGNDVKILDAKTGEDLTRGILMQIIVEDNKGGPAGLPLEVLRQLIMASDHIGREFLTWYLKSAFDAYGKVQQSFSNRFSDLEAAATSPVKTIRNLFIPPPKQDESEVEALKKRLLELETRVRKHAPREKPKKVKSKGTSSKTRKT